MLLLLPHLLFLLLLVKRRPQLYHVGEFVEAVDGVADVEILQVRLEPVLHWTQLSWIDKWRQLHGLRLFSSLLTDF